MHGMGTSSGHRLLRHGIIIESLYQVTLCKVDIRRTIFRGNCKAILAMATYIGWKN
jgi:hypothetical protein